MTVKVHEVRRFDQVRFMGPGVLKITQDDAESLTVHAPSYVMRDIHAVVVDGELRLGYKSPRVVSLRVHREVISYSLKVRELRGLKVTGVGRVIIPDLDNDQIQISVTGIGQVTLEHVTADRFDVKISGAGIVKAQGDVEAQSIAISGAGRYQASRLISDFALVNISGAGTADVSVAEDLDVVISGAGSVTYAGYPEITKRISPMGHLSRRRRGRREEKGEEHG
ncbi:MAG: head GIN domain-containing protein [Pseudomonadales bacterium]